MYLIATFEHNGKLELALSELESNGVDRSHILLAALDKRQENIRLFDNLHYSDGNSLIDLAAVLGTIAMLFGSIYGYLLPGGPIIWALIGLAGGSLLGFAIKVPLLRRENRRIYGRLTPSEAVMILYCVKSDMKRLEDILWAHLAMGVARLWENDETPS